VCIFCNRFWLFTKFLELLACFNSTKYKWLCVALRDVIPTISFHVYASLSIIDSSYRIGKAPRKLIAEQIRHDLSLI